MDNRFYPDREYQLLWIRYYLETWNEQTNCEIPLTDLAVERFYVHVRKFSLVSIYSQTQIAHGENYDIGNSIKVHLLLLHPVGM